MGGSSSEHEISLLTGNAVAKGLEEAGYTVTPVIVSETDTFTLPEGTEAVFVALHGTFGEDGGIQTVLEQMKVPYTASRPESSKISFDKVLALEAFVAAGVPIPDGYIIPHEGEVGPLELPLPVVVKPSCQGSSVGITIVNQISEFEPAVNEARKHDKVVIVEAFIPGREWTVSVLGTDALPIIEITPRMDGGWYSWNAKYKSGGTTGYTFPEDDETNAAVAAEVRCIALQAFKAVDAWSVGRVDFRVSPEGRPYVLELNSIPGCTENSILPKAAAKAGIPFPELCARIMEDAKCG